MRACAAGDGGSGEAGGGGGDVSAVSLRKRLRKSGDGLQALGVALFRDRGLALAAEDGCQVRAFAAPPVKEPGQTGSLWRLPSRVRLPSLPGAFFRLPATAGPGTGASCLRFPLRAGAPMLAARGYATGPGLRQVVCEGGGVTGRVNPSSLVLKPPEGAPCALLAAAGALRRAGASGSWQVKGAVKGAAAGPGRSGARRKTKEASRIAEGKLTREASRKGNQVQPATLICARSVSVCPPCPEPAFSARDVLEWDRGRGQVALVFKRCKALAQLGPLPTSEDASARAERYGNSRGALLTDKLIHHASALAPWGYDLEAPAERLGRLHMRPPSEREGERPRPAAGAQARRMARHRHITGGPPTPTPVPALRSFQQQRPNKLTLMPPPPPPPRSLGDSPAGCMRCRREP